MQNARDARRFPITLSRHVQLPRNRRRPPRARPAALLREKTSAANSTSTRFAAHDIKLELDERAQELITQIILARFPDHAIYGEEGMGGNPDGEFQWIVDPLDGTVNYFYGIPHFCVSSRCAAARKRGDSRRGYL